MRIEYFCFIVAALAALTGLGLGIQMGIAQDFALTPVHAHLNLLGWVTMALYGLYYRGSDSSPGLAWVQGLHRGARLSGNDRRPSADEDPQSRQYACRDYAEFRRVNPDHAD